MIHAVVKIWRYGNPDCFRLTLSGRLLHSGTICPEKKVIRFKKSIC